MLSQGHVGAPYTATLTELAPGLGTQGHLSQCPMDPMVAWETKDGEE